MASLEEKEQKLELAKRFRFLSTAFSSEEQSPVVTSAIAQYYHAANPTSRFEGPLMKDAIDFGLQNAGIPVQHLYDSLASIGILPNRYFEFFLQLTATKVFDQVLQSQPQSDINQAIAITNAYELKQAKTKLRDRYELATILSNNNFNSLLIVTTATAVALGSNRFLTEIIPHLDVMDRSTAQGKVNFRVLDAVRQFITQPPEHTGGIDFSVPIRSTDELPQRIQIAFAPPDHPHAMAHFLFADNLAAFRATRRCPFPNMVRHELQVVEEGFESQNTRNRFLNRITRVIGRKR